MRKLIYGLLGLAALVLVAAAVIVLTLDLNGYKPEIEAELERATGRDVTIGGDIHVTVLPSLALAVDDLRIAGVPGASGEPLLSLPRAQAVVALLPLLSGEVQIERVRLVAPVVVLERGADGEASWALDTGGGQGGNEPAVSIGRLEIEDGTVIWRDEAGERRLSQLSLTAAALSLDGPFEAKGEFVHEDATWMLGADVGRISRPQVPINLRFAMPSGQITLAGSVDLSGPLPAFGGQTQIEGETLGAMLALAGLDVQALPGGLAAQPFSIDSGLSVSGDAVLLGDTALSLGETRAFGQASLVLDGPRPAGDLVLEVARLDLDSLLAGVGAAGDQADGVGFALPEDFDLSVDLSVDAAIYRGQALRQLRVVAGLSGGVLELSRMAGQLPGGTAVALAGALRDENGAATFRGPLEASSDNLRATLAWLGEDLRDVPADRLRRVDVVADMVVQPGMVAASDIDLRFDSSRLTGDAGFRFGEVPGITARIAVDRLNLDAYLAPPNADAESTGASQGAFVMPALPRADIELDARIAQLTYNGVLVGGAIVAGRLRDGALDVDSLGAADIAGATVRTSGTVDPAAGRIDVKLGVQAEDAGDLLRLLGIALPIEASRLGRVELTGEINGGTDQAVVRQRLDTSLGQASIDGALLDVLGSPGFDGRVGLRASSYRTLAQAFDLTLPQADDSEIAFAADITTDGTMADINAVLEMLGMKVRATGHGEALQSSPTYDLRMIAEHGELADLMAALGTGGSDRVGPLKLDLSAVGGLDRADITLSPSSLGDSSFRGTAALDFGGQRPRAQVRLQAGVLALDPFLALSSAGTLGDGSPGAGEGGAGQGGAPGGRWSSEPIDLAALHAVDGTIELTAERASLQGMILTGPTIVASLDGGIFTIERFDGGLFDGRIQATGSVAQGVPHRMELDFSLADTDAAQVLKHFADSDRVSGRLFLNGTVGAAGLSQRDLVQGLVGSGNLSLRNGAVQGFDLGEISDRLGNLDNQAAIVAMLARAGSGGQTPIQAADGTFTMADGIARSDDLKVVLEGGRADFTMTADLPRWWLDLAGEAVLTQHSRAPTIPISVRGPIDAPTRVVDTSALEAFLAQRAAETALRKLGGDSEATGAAGAVLDMLTGGRDAAVVTPQEASPAQTAPAAPQDDATQALPPEPEERPQPATGSGSLLDLLTGGVQQRQPAPAESEEPAPPAGDAGLDGEALLRDLLQSLGN